MFYSLKGNVSDILQSSIVLDVNGLGFLVNTSLKTISGLQQGEIAKLYISESIGETNFDLFGFADLQEKRFFEMLTSVSGVGPKAAISLLSAMTPDLLLLAIVNDDAKALTAAPGIGKKIAQRIILELRDKMGAELPSSGSGTSAILQTASPGNTNVSDAMAALTVLGYGSAEINPILRSRDWSGLSTEEIIREILKTMV